MVGRRWAGVAAWCVVGFQLSGAASGPTFRSATELVNVNVSVVGANAKPLEGLTQDQFEVFEDGVRQDVKFFAPGAMPIDVAVILDASSSMAGSLGIVQPAAIRFMRALRTGDRASLMAISNGLRILQPFTGDVTALESATRSVSAAGKTPLYASIYAALRELERLRRSETEPRRQALIVLSDGQDTSSGFDFNELMATVRRMAVPIYAIAPRPSEAARVQREAVFGESTHEQDFELRTLAAETGARAFFPVALQQLSGVYDEIANELAHQYSIGYLSSNPKLDGTFRQITLRITVPGVKWRTRSGYVAQRELATAAGGELR
jgi:Ca-activated chloride channel family protein